MNPEDVLNDLRNEESRGPRNTEIQAALAANDRQWREKVEGLVINQDADVKALLDACQNVVDSCAKMDRPHSPEDANRWARHVDKLNAKLKTSEDIAKAVLMVKRSYEAKLRKLLEDSE